MHLLFVTVDMGIGRHALGYILWNFPSNGHRDAHQPGLHTAKDERSGGLPRIRAHLGK